VTTDVSCLRVEYVPISALRLDPQNPRLHSDRQIRQLAQSIKSFGFNAPVLVDRNDVVRAGHARVYAAQKLGLAQIPVIRLEHLTPAQARAFAIADNRLAELATWDDRLLGEIFRDLAAVDLEFSLEVTGFTMGEIDLRIEGLSQANQSDPADDVPHNTNEIAVTHAGDLFQLGRHRLLCGSALERASFAALLDRSQAGLVFTDPPYNVRIEGHASGLGATHHREFAMASGEMTSDQFVLFLTAALKNLAQNSSDGSVHYICMDWRHQRELLTAAKEAYGELVNLCVWVKTNAGMGSLYRSQHELVYVFKNGTGPHRNNVQLGQYGRNRTNVWQYPGANSFGRSSEEGNLLALHPTVKPVALIADAILDCSARGDIVLDAFVGSGSTLIAAERVGRSCYGIEIDPLYVDTAVRRWQRYTGDCAIHAVTGRTFDDLAVEREACHG
jgi:DNA modification methylase